MVALHRILHPETTYLLWPVHIGPWVVALDRFHCSNNHFHHELPQRVFSEYTEAIITSLIPLESIFLEECAFIIGFSYTVWTKTRFFAGSLLGGAPFTFLQSHKYKESKGSSIKNLM